MPLPVGSISPNAALAAIAASTAEPPAFITSSAIWVASGCEVAAIACGAYTSLRVAKGSPVMRSAAPAAAVVQASSAAARRARVIGGLLRVNPNHTARGAPRVRPSFSGGPPGLRVVRASRYRLDHGAGHERQQHQPNQLFTRHAAVQPG